MFFRLLVWVCLSRGSEISGIVVVVVVRMVCCEGLNLVVMMGVKWSGWKISCMRCWYMDVLCRIVFVMIVVWYVCWYL